MAQYKEMLHMLKFVSEMRTYRLNFLLLNSEIWKLVGISDVNFASDKELHISITGYVIYFMGIPIALLRLWTERCCNFNNLSRICGIVRGCDYIEICCDGSTIYGD